MAKTQFIIATDLCILILCHLLNSVATNVRDWYRSKHQASLVRLPVAATVLTASWD